MTVVFTNGCFDLIHRGHIDFLERARALGERLVVGLNSDRSVRAIKGPIRPLIAEDDRARVLRALRSVDQVIVFDEPTPARLIESVKPDVLVKGGDWPVDQIVGADFVLGHGGRVFSLPATPGYSTTKLIMSMSQSQTVTVAPGGLTIATDEARDPVADSVDDHLETITRFRHTCLGHVKTSADMISAALKSGKRLFLCGNGGSAADAQHIAAEFMGRFEMERQAYPAIALTTNASTVTAIGNDYGFDRVFARQLEGLAGEGDVLVGISTSGTSQNVILAVMAARRLGCRSVGLTGANGTRLASLCDAAIMVPSTRTSRIQEMHVMVGHLWCEFVDATMQIGSVASGDAGKPRSV